MKRRLTAAVVSVVLVMGSGCYHARHYVDDAKRMDGVYFGKKDKKQKPNLRTKDEWRNYYLFGLIPSSESDVEFAGGALSSAASRASAVTEVEVTTKKSFLNGLAEIGVSIIPFVGLLRPFFFNPRSAEVTGTSR
jgi:hypothetical protein